MSIKEIAKLVGASTSTVSRVLNDPEYRCRIPGMREKIWEAAIEMNYVPNEAARNLKMGQAKGDRIYYLNILATRMDASQSDPFFTELLQVVESEIHNNMCILSKVWYMPVFSDDRKCRTEDISGIIEDMYRETEGQCDGLIVIGKCSGYALQKLVGKYKNVVSVNRNSTNYAVDEVLCDGQKIASMAVEYLISLGHREIAYVGECHNEARYKGFLAALRNHDIDPDPNYIIETKQTEAQGFACMEKLMELEPYPTGVYCANDITAVGMLKYLEQHRSLRVRPSIIASDDIAQAQNTRPMLTTVHLPKNEMAKFALYLILDRIRGKHSCVVRTEMEGRLVVRSSCAAPGQRNLDYE